MLSAVCALCRSVESAVAHDLSPSQKDNLEGLIRSVVKEVTGLEMPPSLSCSAMNEWLAKQFGERASKKPDEAASEKWKTHLEKTRQERLKRAIAGLGEARKEVPQIPPPRGADLDQPAEGTDGLPLILGQEGTGWLNAIAKERQWFLDCLQSAQSGLFLRFGGSRPHFEAMLHLIELASGDAILSDDLGPFRTAMDASFFLGEAIRSRTSAFDRTDEDSRQEQICECLELAPDIGRLTARAVRLRCRVRVECIEAERWLADHGNIFRLPAATEEHSDGIGGAFDQQEPLQPVPIVNYYDHSINIEGDIEGSNVAVGDSKIASFSASYNNREELVEALTALTPLIRSGAKCEEDVVGAAIKVLIRAAGDPSVSATKVERAVLVVADSSPTLKQRLGDIAGRIGVGLTGAAIFQGIKMALKIP